MSSIQFGSTMSLLDAATPSGWLVAYDIDGVLKQKDEFGVITPIGGGPTAGIGVTPSLSSVLQIGNTSGTYSISLGTSASIISSNGNARLDLDFGTSSSVRLTNGTNTLLLSNSTNSITTNASSTFSVSNSSNTFRISTTTLLSSNNEIDLRVYNNSNKLLIKTNIGITVSSANLDTNAGILIGSRNSSVGQNLNNTVVIGGTGIIARASNSVYVPDLYIQDGKSIYTTDGSGSIKLDSENNIISQTNNSLIGIVSSTNSSSLTVNGVLVSDTNSSVSSPSVDSSVTFISTNNSTANAGVKNSVAIGGSNLNILLDDTVYLGNSVNINNAYTLPSTDGLSGQVLQTDGSGSVAWISTAETQNLSDVLSNGNDSGVYDIFLGTQSYLKSKLSSSEIWLDYGLTNSILLTTDGGTLNTSYVLLEESNLTIEVDSSLNINANDSTVVISNGQGLVYGFDYTSSFVTYSLISKNYVDLATASIWNQLQNNVVVGVTAGEGLSGGGTGSYITLDVNLLENSGLTFSSDEITLELNSDSIEVDSNNQIRLKDSISGDRTFTDTITVNGNLNILGTASYVHTQELFIADSNITLLATYSSGSPFLDAGINVSRGSSQSASILWNETDDFWQVGLSGSESTIITEAGSGLIKSDNTLSVDFATVSSVQYVDSATASIYNYIDNNIVVAGNGLTQSSGIIKLGGNLTEQTTIYGATALGPSNIFKVQDVFQSEFESTSGSNLIIGQLGVNLYSPSGDNYITVQDGEVQIVNVSSNNFFEFSEFDSIFSNQVTIGDLISGGTASNGMIRFNGSNFQGYKSGNWVDLDVPVGVTPSLSDVLLVGNITNGTDIVTSNDDVIIAATGGGVLNLRFNNNGGVVVGLPSSIYGGKGGSGNGGGVLYLDPSGITLGLNGGDYSKPYVYLTTQYSQMADYSTHSSVYYGFNMYRNSSFNNYSNGVSIKENVTFNFTSSNQDNYSVIIGSRNSTANAGVYNSPIIGGQGLNATQSNTVYLGNTVNINNAYTLPNTDGSNGDILTTNGLGVASWQNTSSIGLVSKYSATSSFTSGVTQSISHTLNSEDIIVQTYDSSGNQVIPGNIQIVGTSSVDILFSQSLSSVKIVMIG